SAGIRSNTQKQYHDWIATLVLFRRMYRLDSDGRESLDIAVAALLNHQFRDGRCSDLGRQLITALLHVIPGLARRSGRYLPRVCRAAGAWKRRDPGRSRLPMPRTGVAAIAEVMLYLGRRRMAIYTTLDFICYCRPLEGIALLGRLLVSPVLAAGASCVRWGLLLHDFELGLLSRTDTSDDAGLTDQASWTSPAVAGLQAAAHTDASLWDFDATEFRLTFKAAAEVHNDVFSFGDVVMTPAATLGKHGLAGPLFDQSRATGHVTHLVHGGDVGAHLAKRLVTNLGRAVRLKSLLFLELFGGCGRVAASAQAIGYAALSLDINASPLENHLTPAFLNRVLGWISGGVIAG
ncbi:unnamed protein product, partial [Prorocentrum cordatum]